MLVKPSVGKYVISFIIIHSPTWDGSGLFLGDSVDHQHPREGQGLIPSGWFCVHSKIILMAYPCNVTPLQSQGSTWTWAFTSRPPNQTRMTRGCKPVQGQHLQAGVTLKPFAEAGQ